MSEPYVIEPPAEKRREMSLDRKLDRIIDLVTHREEEPATDDGSTPEVTFEADPDQLPQTADDGEGEEGEGEEGEGAPGQGEGTTNVSDQTKRGIGFRFPSAKRHAVIER